MKLLVTGGAGFIGSNFVLYMLHRHPEYQIVNVDALTYAGNLENLKSVKNYPNHIFVKADITDEQVMETLISQGVDVIGNFAAESHVDRSILEPDVFVKTNVLGTQVLLEAARKHSVQKFVQVSTDKVYGTLGDMGLFTKETPLHIVRTILKQLSKPESLIKQVQDRPSHDRRYRIDPTKVMQELGWNLKNFFETEIKETIRWHLDNKDWWTRIQSGAFQDYYAKQYGKRFGSDLA